MPSLDALRRLTVAETADLAQALRSLLVEKVCARGGHMGSNLGVVELTLALHRVFKSPRDALVFDIGHQAYIHKMLTGRAAAFDRLRQAGGLSGYPARGESEHDVVENSHASTSLSYAQGLARAYQLSGQADRRVVAVIGDGALGGGMAFEALNSLGAWTARSLPVVIVVNDNGRSYAPTCGALAGHLAGLEAGQSRYPNVFAELGLAYLGPVDGHDLPAVEQVLRQARDMGRPVIVHAKTVKGRGFGPAQADERDCLHAVGVTDPHTGRPPASVGAQVAPSWTRHFAQYLLELAAERPEVVGVTAGMLEPTGLDAMAAAFPERVFDVGIAEQHAVTCAAGLAMGGLHPVVAVYSTFLSRAVDQVLMDVALHRLPVTFVADRAGVTGPDGPSHHGMWDLALFAAVPGLRIAAPRDAVRLRELLREAVTTNAPTLLRLPKATASAPLEAVDHVGGVDILHRSAHGAHDVLLIALGALAPDAVSAAQLVEADQLGATVVDLRWVHPVPEAVVALAERHRCVVTVEDGLGPGGIGSRILQILHERGVQVPVRVLGLPPAFLPAGSRPELLAHAGLDAAGIARSVRRLIQSLPGRPAAAPASPSQEST
ncbi:MULTISPECIES: 1-deoxy-D-xylulose-5-phosphate synthase [unclassified Streptomyces]|uniref:1-deoxy-D-xylulose-5-phosphate synthase n=1 Tax=Streptomyces sp. NBC_00060 TaxID=2975636 RepID=A0AAU2HDJ8_9ACTN